MRVKEWNETDVRLQGQGTLSSRLSKPLTSKRLDVGDDFVIDAGSPTRCVAFDPSYRSNATTERNHVLVVGVDEALQTWRVVGDKPALVSVTTPLDVLSVEFAPHVEPCDERQGVVGCITTDGAFVVVALPRVDVDSDIPLRLRGGGPHKDDDDDDYDIDNDSQAEDWEVKAEANRVAAAARNDSFAAKSSLLAYRASCDLDAKMPEHAKSRVRALVSYCSRRFDAMSAMTGQPPPPPLPDWRTWTIELYKRRSGPQLDVYFLDDVGRRYRSKNDAARGLGYERNSVSSIGPKSSAPPTSTVVAALCRLYDSDSEPGVGVDVDAKDAPNASDASDDDDQPRGRPMRKAAKVARDKNLDVVDGVGSALTLLLGDLSDDFDVSSKSAPNASTTPAKKMKMTPHLRKRPRRSGVRDVAPSIVFFGDSKRAASSFCWISTASRTIGALVGTASGDVELYDFSTDLDEISQAPARVFERFSSTSISKIKCDETDDGLLVVCALSKDGALKVVRLDDGIVLDERTKVDDFTMKKGRVVSLEGSTLRWEANATVEAPKGTIFLSSSWFSEDSFFCGTSNGRTYLVSSNDDPHVVVRTGIDGSGALGFSRVGGEPEGEELYDPPSESTFGFQKFACYRPESGFLATGSDQGVLRLTRIVRA